MFQLYINLKDNKILSFSEDNEEIPSEKLKLY